MIIKLRNALDSRDKSIYWLSKQTGIAASTLSRICNNKTTSIDFSVLDKICEALNCDIGDILVPEKSNLTL